MDLTIDCILGVVQQTLFHPWWSFALMILLLFLQDAFCDKESTNLRQNRAFYLAIAMRMAVGCTAISWLSKLNSTMSRKALNPSSGISCDWSNEIVVVTGGSGGIGEEIVEKVVGLGAKVVIMDVRPPNVRHDKQVYYFQTNVASYESVVSAFKDISAAIGSPSILIANAGIFNGRGILEASRESLHDTFDINVLGVLYCIQVFLPSMIKANHGHVLITSSIKAYTTVANATHYSASKAALIPIIAGLQTELKHKHGNPSVKVSAIFPAIVNTKMSHSIKQPISRFILPILEAEQVAEKIIEMLSNGKSALLMMPAMANFGPILHVLPHWIRVFVQDIGASAISTT